MQARDTRFPIDAWIRRCQECGNVQVEKNLPTYGVEPSDRFKNRACKRCKSESLDYGTTNQISEEYADEQE